VTNRLHLRQISRTEPGTPHRPR